MITIRPESPGDHETLHDFIKTAFQTARVKDGTEQDFAARLRLGPGYIPELALVAEENGQLAGQVMLTKIPLDCGEKTVTELLLGPISVELSRRNKGVGGALIKEAFRRAKNLGFRAVFLAGDPGYYGRFGFRKTTDFGIKNMSEIPDQYILACELFPGALKDRQGSINIKE